MPVIAIDGPSASGTGTVAGQVASALGFHFLDSGALYRLVALSAIRSGQSPDGAEALGRLARELPASFEHGRIHLAGEDVTDAIRDESCSVMASRVAAVPVVRDALLERQRAYRRAPGLVADGRDMGSVVFPDASVKIFLTASAEARAQRRYKQLMEKGLAANIAGLTQEMRERDERDAARPVAPLARVSDAVLLDTSEMTVEDAVRRVLDQVAAAAN